MSQITPEPNDREQKSTPATSPALRPSWLSQVKPIIHACLLPGAIVSFIGGLLCVGANSWAYNEARITKPEPAEMTLDELVANGPPADNAFVRVTNAEAGPNYVLTVTKKKYNTFDRVDIPFFGERLDASGKRSAILVACSRKKVEDISQRTTLTGVVSYQKTWSENDTNKLLRKEYPDYDFSSVWVLLPQEQVATQGQVLAYWIGWAFMCFAAFAFLLYKRLKWREA